MPNSRPHVAISAHLLHGAAGYRSAGIHTYIAHLLQHLPEADPAFRYTVYTNAQPEIDARCARVRSSRWPTARPAIRIAWEQLAQPVALWRDRPDLLHAAAFVSPLMSRRPTVITVYDLSFALFPEYFRGPNQAYLRTFTRLSLKRARRVIAISDHTRRDVGRLYGVPLDRIDVAYPGVAAHFRPMPHDEVDAFRRKHNLPGRFFLYLGTLEPRKNISRLIDAFAQITDRGIGVEASAGLRRQARPRPDSVDAGHTVDREPYLVLVGGKGWLYDELFAKVKSLGLEERVRFAGFAPNEDLPLWYSAATAFVYPSTYEGFGIPPLEAMACGTPVIASNASSLPEAVGDAAVTIEPEDVSGLAQAMQRVWDDEALRVKLSQHGIARAGRFTWDATARATVESYRKALDEDFHAPALSQGGST